MPPVITCDVCSRKLRPCRKPPLICSCGNRYEESFLRENNLYVSESQAQTVIIQQKALGVGTELRKMLGCDCKELPFRDWDLKGPSWCQANLQKLAKEVSEKEGTGTSAASAKQLVQKAINKVLGARNIWAVGEEE